MADLHKEVLSIEINLDTDQAMTQGADLASYLDERIGDATKLQTQYINWAASNDFTEKTNKYNILQDPLSGFSDSINSIVEGYKKLKDLATSENFTTALATPIREITFAMKSMQDQMLNLTSKDFTEKLTDNSIKGKRKQKEIINSFFTTNTSVKTVDPLITQLETLYKDRKANMGIESSSTLQTIMNNLKEYVVSSARSVNNRNRTTLDIDQLSHQISTDNSFMPLMDTALQAAKIGRNRVTQNQKENIIKAVLLGQANRSLYAPDRSSRTILTGTEKDSDVLFYEELIPENLRKAFQNAGRPNDSYSKNLYKQSIKTASDSAFNDNLSSSSTRQSTYENIKKLIESGNLQAIELGEEVGFVKRNKGVVQLAKQEDITAGDINAFAGLAARKAYQQKRSYPYYEINPNDLTQENRLRNRENKAYIDLLDVMGAVNGMENLNPDIAYLSPAQERNRKFKSIKRNITTLGLKDSFIVPKTTLDEDKEGLETFTRDYGWKKKNGLNEKKDDQFVSISRSAVTDLIGLTGSGSYGFGYNDTNTYEAKKDANPLIVKLNLEEAIKAVEDENGTTKFVENSDRKGYVEKVKEALNTRSFKYKASNQKDSSDYTIGWYDSDNAFGIRKDRYDAIVKDWEDKGLGNPFEMFGKSFLEESYQSMIKGFDLSRKKNTPSVSYMEAFGYNKNPNTAYIDMTALYDMVGTPEANPFMRQNSRVDGLALIMPNSSPVSFQFRDAMGSMKGFMQKTDWKRLFLDKTIETGADGKPIVLKDPLGNNLINDKEDPAFKRTSLFDRILDDPKNPYRFLVDEFGTNSSGRKRARLFVPMLGAGKEEIEEAKSKLGKLQETMNKNSNTSPEYNDAKKEREEILQSLFVDILDQNLEALITDTTVKPGHKFRYMPTDQYKKLFNKKAPTERTKDGMVTLIPQEQSEWLKGISKEEGGGLRVANTSEEMRTSKQFIPESLAVAMGATPKMIEESNKNYRVYYNQLENDINTRYKYLMSIPQGRSLLSNPDWNNSDKTKRLIQNEINAKKQMQERGDLFLPELIEIAATGVLPGSLFPFKEMFGKNALDKSKLGYLKDVFLNKNSPIAMFLNRKWEEAGVSRIPAAPGENITAKLRVGQKGARYLKSLGLDPEMFYLTPEQQYMQMTGDNDGDTSWIFRALSEDKEALFANINRQREALNNARQRFQEAQQGPEPQSVKKPASATNAEGWFEFAKNWRNAQIAMGVGSAGIRNAAYRGDIDSDEMWLRMAESIFYYDKATSEFLKKGEFSSLGSFAGRSVREGSVYNRFIRQLSDWSNEEEGSDDEKEQRERIKKNLFRANLPTMLEADAILSIAQNNSLRKVGLLGKSQFESNLADFIEKAYIEKGKTEDEISPEVKVARWYGKLLSDTATGRKVYNAKETAIKGRDLANEWFVDLEKRATSGKITHKQYDEEFKRLQSLRSSITEFETRGINVENLKDIKNRFDNKAKQYQEDIDKYTTLLSSSQTSYDEENKKLNPNGGNATSQQLEELKKDVEYNKRLYDEAVANKNKAEKVSKSIDLLLAAPTPDEQMSLNMQNMLANASDLQERKEFKTRFKLYQSRLKDMNGSTGKNPLAENPLAYTMMKDLGLTAGSHANWSDVSPWLYEVSQTDAFKDKFKISKDDITSFSLDGITVGRKAYPTYSSDITFNPYPHNPEGIEAQKAKIEAREIDSRNVVYGKENNTAIALGQIRHTAMEKYWQDYFSNGGNAKKSIVDYFGDILVNSTYLKDFGIKAIKEDDGHIKIDYENAINATAEEINLLRKGIANSLGKYDENTRTYTGGTLQSAVSFLQNGFGNQNIFGIKKSSGNPMLEGKIYQVDNNGNLNNINASDISGRGIKQNFGVGYKDERGNDQTAKGTFAPDFVYQNANDKYTMVDYKSGSEGALDALFQQYIYSYDLFRKANGIGAIDPNEKDNYKYLLSNEEIDYNGNKYKKLNIDKVVSIDLTNGNVVSAILNQDKMLEFGSAYETAIGNKIKSGQEGYKEGYAYLKSILKKGNAFSTDVGLDLAKTGSGENGQQTASDFSNYSNLLISRFTKDEESLKSIDSFIYRKINKNQMSGYNKISQMEHELDQVMNDEVINSMIDVAKRNPDKEQGNALIATLNAYKAKKETDKQLLLSLRYEEALSGFENVNSYINTSIRGGKSFDVIDVMKETQQNLLNQRSVFEGMKEDKTMYDGTAWIKDATTGESKYEKRYNDAVEAYKNADDNYVKYITPLVESTITANNKELKSLTNIGNNKPTVKDDIESALEERKAKLEKYIATQAESIRNIDEQLDKTDEAGNKIIPEVSEKYNLYQRLKNNAQTNMDEALKVLGDESLNAKAENEIRKETIKKLGLETKNDIVRDRSIVDKFDFPTFEEYAKKNNMPTPLADAYQEVSTLSFNEYRKWKGLPEFTNIINAKDIPSKAPEKITINEFRKWQGLNPFEGEVGSNEITLTKEQGDEYLKYLKDNVYEDVKLTDEEKEAYNKPLRELAYGKDVANFFENNFKPERDKALKSRLEYQDYLRRIGYSDTQLRSNTLENERNLLLNSTADLFTDENQRAIKDMWINQRYISKDSQLIDVMDSDLYNIQKMYGFKTDVDSEDMARRMYIARARIAREKYLEEYQSEMTDEEQIAFGKKYNDTTAEQEYLRLKSLENTYKNSIIAYDQKAIENSNMYSQDQLRYNLGSYQRNQTYGAISTIPFGAGAGIVRTLQRRDMLSQQSKAYDMKIKSNDLQLAKISAAINATEDKEKQKELNSRYSELDLRKQGLQSEQDLVNKELNKYSGAGGVLNATGNVVAGVTKSATNFVSRFASRYFYTIINEAKNFVKQYDAAMTEIQMITLKTDEEMSKLGEGFIDTAKELKTSISDVTKVATALYRQGLNDTEVDERLETIMKFSKVSGTDSTAATKLITTALNTGLATDVNYVADVVTALGDNAATNAAQIEKGIEKAGAAAAADGTTFEQLSAMLTAITSTTQVTGNVAGTTMNAIFSRMNKIGTNDLIMDENGKIVNSSDLVNILKAAGIDSYDTSGNKRSTFDILKSLSDVWDTLGDQQQQQIATAIAGTRQYSNFAAIMTGMKEGKIDEYLNLTENAEGTVDDKYQNYLDSLNASLAELKATFDSLFSTLNENGVLTGVFDFFINLTEGFNVASESGQGLITTLGILIPLLIALNGLKSGTITGTIVGLVAGVASYIGLSALANKGANARSQITGEDIYETNKSNYDFRVEYRKQLLTDYENILNKMQNNTATSEEKIRAQELANKFDTIGNSTSKVTEAFNKLTNSQGNAIDSTEDFAAALNAGTKAVKQRNQEEAVGVLTSAGKNIEEKATQYKSEASSGSNYIDNNLIEEANKANTNEGYRDILSGIYYKNNSYYKFNKNYTNVTEDEANNVYNLFSDYLKNIFANPEKYENSIDEKNKEIYNFAKEFTSDLIENGNFNYNDITPEYVKKRFDSTSNKGFKYEAPLNPWFGFTVYDLNRQAASGMNIFSEYGDSKVNVTEDFLLWLLKPITSSSYDTVDNKTEQDVRNDIESTLKTYFEYIGLSDYFSEKYNQEIPKNFISFYVNALINNMKLNAKKSNAEVFTDINYKSAVESIFTDTEGNVYTPEQLVQNAAANEEDFVTYTLQAGDYFKLKNETRISRTEALAGIKGKENEILYTVNNKGELVDASDPNNVYTAYSDLFRPSTLSTTAISYRANNATAIAADKVYESLNKGIYEELITDENSLGEWINTQKLTEFANLTADEEFANFLDETITLNDEGKYQLKTGEDYDQWLSQMFALVASKSKSYTGVNKTKFYTASKAKEALDALQGKRLFTESDKVALADYIKEDNSKRLISGTINSDGYLEEEYVSAEEYFMNYENKLVKLKDEQIEALKSLVGDELYNKLTEGKATNSERAYAGMLVSNTVYGNDGLTTYQLQSNAEKLLADIMLGTDNERTINFEEGTSSTILSEYSKGITGLDVYYKADQALKANQSSLKAYLAMSDEDKKKYAYAFNEAGISVEDISNATLQLNENITSIKWDKFAAGNKVLQDMKNNILELAEGGAKAYEVISSIGNEIAKGKDIDKALANSGSSLYTDDIISYLGITAEMYNADPETWKAFAVNMRSAQKNEQAQTYAGYLQGYLINEDLKTKDMKEVEALLQEKDKSAFDLYTLLSNMLEFNIDENGKLVATYKDSYVSDNGMINANALYEYNKNNKLANYTDTAYSKIMSYKNHAPNDSDYLTSVLNTNKGQDWYQYLSKNSEFAGMIDKYFDTDKESGDLVLKDVFKNSQENVYAFIMDWIESNSKTYSTLATLTVPETIALANKVKNDSGAWDLGQTVLTDLNKEAYRSIVGDTLYNATLEKTLTPQQIKEINTAIANYANEIQGYSDLQKQNKALNIYNQIISGSKKTASETDRLTELEFTNSISGLKDLYLINEKLSEQEFTISSYFSEDKSSEKYQAATTALEEMGYTEAYIINLQQQLKESVAEISWDNFAAGNVVLKELSSTVKNFATNGTKALKVVSSFRSEFNNNKDINVALTAIEAGTATQKDYDTVASYVNTDAVSYDMNKDYWNRYARTLLGSEQGDLITSISGTLQSRFLNDKGNSTLTQDAWEQTLSGLVEADSSFKELYDFAKEIGTLSLDENNNLVLTPKEGQQINAAYKSYMTGLLNYRSNNATGLAADKMYKGALYAPYRTASEMYSELKKYDQGAFNTLAEDADIANLYSKYFNIDANGNATLKEEYTDAEVISSLRKAYASKSINYSENAISNKQLAADALAYFNDRANSTTEQKEAFKEIVGESLAEEAEKGFKSTENRKYAETLIANRTLGIEGLTSYQLQNKGLELYNSINNNDMTKYNNVDDSIISAYKGSISGLETYYNINEILRGKGSSIKELETLDKTTDRYKELIAVMEEAGYSTADLANAQYELNNSIQSVSWDNYAAGNEILMNMKSNIEAINKGGTQAFEVMNNIRSEQKQGIQIDAALNMIDKGNMSSAYTDAVISYLNIETSDFEKDPIGSIAEAKRRRKIEITEAETKTAGYMTNALKDYTIKIPIDENGIQMTTVDSQDALSLDAAIANKMKQDPNFAYTYNLYKDRYKFSVDESGNIVADYIPYTGEYDQGSLFYGKTTTPTYESIMDLGNQILGANQDNIGFILSNAQATNPALYSSVMGIDGFEQFTTDTDAGIEASTERIEELQEALRKAAITMSDLSNYSKETADNMDLFSSDARKAASSTATLNKTLTAIANNKYYSDKFKAGARDGDTVGAIAGMLNLDKEFVKDKKNTNIIEEQLDALEQSDFDTIGSYLDSAAVLLNEAIANNKIDLEGPDINVNGGSVSFDLSEVESALASMGADQQARFIKLLESFGIEATYVIDKTKNGGKGYFVVNKVAGKKSGGGGGGGGKSDAQKAIEAAKRRAESEDHIIKMIQSEEQKYEGRQELKNVNILIEKENEAQKHLIQTNEESIATLKEKLKQTTKESDDYYSLIEAIKSYEESIASANNAIEENIRKIRQNNEAILKAQTSLEDAIDAEIKTRIDAEKQMLAGTVSMEETILNAIKTRYTKEWELLKKSIEKQKEALEEEKNILSERLDARKEADDEAKKYEELNSYKSQLVELEKDSTKTKEAKELRKKISDIENELYWKSMEDQVEAQQEAIDDQESALDDYVTYYDEDLQDMLNNANNFAEEVSNVMGLSYENLIVWLQANDETYKNSLASTQEQMVQSWEDTWKQMRGIVDTFWDEIFNIMSSKETFLEYMQQSESFKNASEANQKLMIMQWEDLWETFFQSTQVDQEAIDYTHDDDYEEDAGTETPTSNPTSPKKNKTVIDTIDEFVKDIPEKITNGINNLVNSVSSSSFWKTISEGVKTGIIQNNANNPLSITPYASGGYVDYTGLAMVHGSPSNPEAFLSVEDTKMVRSLIDNLTKVSVVPTITSFDSTNRSNVSSVGDINITIQEAQLKTDADYQEVANRVGQCFAKELNKAGIPTNNYSW